MLQDMIMDKHEKILDLARRAHEKDSFNGAWLYAENGEIVSKGAVGFRDPEDKEPLTEDSVFQLASVTKQFTAAAVMLAVRKGLLNLDDEIVKYFPQIPYPGVTVRHLLTHTSGIPDYFDDSDWFIDKWKKEDKVPCNDEILNFLCETKAERYGAPGDQYEYSNTGYNLLALLVERLSGVPFEKFLQENIFGPAGMTHTRCCHIRRDGVPFENYAQATVIEDDRYVADVDSEEDRIVTAFDGLNGDDYVYTTLEDMFRWDRVLRKGSVITEEEQQLMYTPVVLNSGEVYRDEDEDDGVGYGFGWGISHRDGLGLVVSHSGGMPGVFTWFERFVDADKVIITLFNRDPMDYRAEDTAWEGIRDIAYGREPGPVVSIEDITVKDPDRSAWESYCGKYEHPEDDDFIIDEICLKDGDLYAEAIDDDGDGFEFRLYPIGENEFGRKRGMVKITFADGSISYAGATCRKI